MARTTKPAKSTESAPVDTPVVTPVESAVPVSEKAPKAKKPKAPKAEAAAAAAPAPVEPVVESAPVEGEVAVEAVDGDVTPVAEKSIEFLAKLQQIGTLLSALKVEYRTLEKQWSRDLKSAQKLGSKRKRKAGNRAPSGFVKPTRISDELATFLEKPAGTELARTEVTREINVYIRNNSLQDAKNGRKINPDSKLASLLKLKKGDELTYFNLQKYMSPHFAKAVKPEVVA
jgi:chromatin remodeling complex protein RSC6